MSKNKVKYVNFGSDRNNSWHVSNAFQEVIHELMEMPDEEFEKLLKQHKDGDIARAMMDSGAAERVLREWRENRPKK